MAGVLFKSIDAAVSAGIAAGASAVGDRRGAEYHNRRAHNMSCMAMQDALELKRSVDNTSEGVVRGISGVGKSIAKPFDDSLDPDEDFEKAKTHFKAGQGIVGELTGLKAVYEAIDHPLCKFFEGGKIGAFHVTDPVAAGAIVEGQHLKSSYMGEMGQGAYVGATPEEAQVKATYKAADAVILAMTVNLGRCRGPISMSERDWHNLMLGTRTDRRRIGCFKCDSIMMERDTGVEYVVFDSSRITDIRVYSKPLL